MAGHVFDPTILREYDIRGIVGKTLGPEDARALGRAFGSELAGTSTGAKPKVVLGFDGRLSSPMLANALADGLVSTGADVIRVGRGPTPMLYFAAHRLGAQGGMMVTGSHNPPDHNGFKMVMRGAAIYGTAIKALGARAAKGDFAAGKGSVAEQPMLEAYVARLLEDAAMARPLKVAWDAGNGAAGEAMALLVKGLPGKHILLNETIDGSFPNHHPDPTVPENLAQLQATVRAERCELGIAFDGDGDRIGVVDGEGRILWGDQFLVFLAADVLSRLPGATIIADVKASQALFDEIARLGGKPLMGRTGHSLIKAKMAETGAPLAGEMSGHVFFADRYYGYDDALYAAVRLLNVVASSPASLAELRDRLPRVVNTPELRIPSSEARKFAVIEEVKGRLERAKADVTGVDGVRVRDADGWWLLRASNTQDVLVARCESSSEAGLER
ncbi:MAG TPA: phosphomannomutase/phosphoglucomutase, partial [Alphaproteobacteria bacterium]|nr:phosphomannomutase/phosphoglucomutase [Alphaproteobacteria bacterium]